MKSRVPEIDTLRGIAILAVIAIHVVRVDSFIQLALRMVAVPLFILVCGYCLSMKYKEPFYVWRFYWKRALTIIPPYLLFSTAYIVAHGLQKGWPAWQEILVQYLTCSASEHLWFIRLILQLYILYPLLEKAARNISFLYLALIVQLISSAFHGPNFTTYGFYFSLGIYMNTWEIKAPEFMRSSWWAEQLQWFGEYSFGIYLIHILFLAAAVRINDGTFFKFFFTAITSLVAVIVINTTPLSPWLIGLKERGKY